MNEKKRRALGPVLILLAGCFWGCMGIFVRRLGAYGFDAIQIVSIRVTLAAAVFWLVLLVREPAGARIRLRDLPLFLGLGLGSVLFFTVCYFAAITMMSLSTAAILLYTSPIWIMLMSVLFFRERLNRRKLLALGLAQPVIYFLSEQYGILHSTTGFSGVMIAMIPVATTLAAAPILGERPSRGQLLFSLLSVGGVVGLGLMNGSSGRLDWIGIAALTAAVLAGSAYSLLARGISRRTTPFDRTYAMVGLGALVFTVPALISCGGDFEVYLRPFGRTPYLLSVLFLSAFCSVLSFFLSNYAISKLPLARETVFANLTTAVSVFAGVLILHEPFSWLSMACILLILIGIWGVQRADWRAADETKHEKQEVST